MQIEPRYASQSNRNCTPIVDMVEQKIANNAAKHQICRSRRKPITRNPEHLYAVISQHFGVSRDDLLSSYRKSKLARARQWGMLLARTEWKELSFPEIGVLFGGRDHSTVMHGVSKIGSEVESSVAARKTMVELVVALQRAEAQP